MRRGHTWRGQGQPRRAARVRASCPSQKGTYWSQATKSFPEAVHVDASIAGHVEETYLSPRSTRHTPMLRWLQCDTTHRHGWRSVRVNEARFHTLPRQPWAYHDSTVDHDKTNDNSMTRPFEMPREDHRDQHLGAPPASPSTFPPPSPPDASGGTSPGRPWHVSGRRSVDPNGPRPQPLPSQSL